MDPTAALPESRTSFDARPPASGAHPALRPDPVLAASIYCAGRLDEVICRAVAPFWRRCHAADDAAASHLWIMRYARRGEHLKVRLHGPPDCSPRLRELLTGEVEEYLGHLAPPAPDAPRPSAPTAPPIDAEDWPAADHADRSLLFTTYVRSQVSLGCSPLLDDDRLVAALTGALACGTDLLFARFTCDDEGRCPFALKRGLLVEALAAGIARLRWPARGAAGYLLYHRDCLLRHLHRHKARAEAPGEGPRAMARVLARFDGEIARLDAAESARIARATKGGRPARIAGAGLAAWSRALRALAAEADRLGGALAQPVDPFAEHPAWPALFKACHGLANQLGIDHLNEAFVHHLLLSMTAPGESARRPVRLTPDL
jgi:hypothetical protein